jgi:hypothetical protein
MLNATFSLLFIGAPVFFLGVALAFRRSMQRRRESATVFRGYFAAIDDRDILQQSDLGGTGTWQSDIHSRYTSFNLRDPEIDELKETASRMVQTDPESF